MLIQSLLAWPTLLAASRRHAHSGVNLPWLWIGLLVLTVAIGIGIYYLLQYRNSLIVDDTRALFRDLCRIHNLSNAKRKLMLILAGNLELANPCVLFMDSTQWRIPEAKPGQPSLSKKQWDRLLACQRELFNAPAVM